MLRASARALRSVDAERRRVREDRDDVRATDAGREGGERVAQEIVEDVVRASACGGLSPRGSGARIGGAAQSSCNRAQRSRSARSFAIDRNTSRSTLMLAPKKGRAASGADAGFVQRAQPPDRRAEDRRELLRLGRAGLMEGPRHRARRAIRESGRREASGTSAANWLWVGTVSSRATTAIGSSPKATSARSGARPLRATMSCSQRYGPPLRMRLEAHVDGGEIDALERGLEAPRDGRWQARAVGGTSKTQGQGRSRRPQWRPAPGSLTRSGSGSSRPWTMIHGRAPRPERGAASRRRRRAARSGMPSRVARARD